MKENNPLWYAGPVYKDFDRWNTMKKSLHYRETPPPFFHEREVWWCALGMNLGHEQDGDADSMERPIAILKRFNSELLLAIPLTSREKKGPYYRKLSTGSVAILTQIRLLSSRRLLRKLSVTIPEEEFETLRTECFKALQ
jgi:mRNA interferase MazF